MLAELPKSEGAKARKPDAEVAGVDQMRPEICPVMDGAFFIDTRTYIKLDYS